MKKEDVEELKIRLNKFAEMVYNEQQTKSVFIEPLLKVLGYDASNPNQVICEYTSDYGIKNGERVDYALKDRFGNIVIFVEAKKIGKELRIENRAQLFRYFTTSDVEVGILTNGSTYMFYTDEVKRNIMDDEPCYVIDINNMTEKDIEFINLFERETFDIDKIKEYLEERRFASRLSDYFNRIMIAPDGDFVKFIAERMNVQGIEYSVVSDIIKREFAAQIDTRARLMGYKDESSYLDLSKSEEKVEGRIMTKEEVDKLKVYVEEEKVDGVNLDDEEVILGK